MMCESKCSGVCPCRQVDHRELGDVLLSMMCYNKASQTSGMAAGESSSAIVPVAVQWVLYRFMYRNSENITVTCSIFF